MLACRLSGDKRHARLGGVLSSPVQPDDMASPDVMLGEYRESSVTDCPQLGVEPVAPPAMQTAE